jgi:GNAT superfamily N-acetyltransferase
MVEIRRATPGDLAALVRLHRGFCEADGHPFDAGRARSAFAPLLDDDRHGVVWIVDEPPAYVVLTWGWSIEAGGPEAVLDEIYTTNRGAGVGSQLIDHVLVDGARRGLARIFLETESHNERVRGLYQRHGFRADDSVWMSHDYRSLS